MNTQIKLSDGNMYALSEVMAARIRAGYGDEWPDEPTAEQERNRLLMRSNNFQLTDEEEAMLDAVTVLKNLHYAPTVLQGRPLSDFGFDTICQVHRNAQRLSCGCRIQFIFDHHKAQAGKPHEHHPHPPTHMCKEHRGINDWREHYRIALDAHNAKALKE